MLVALYIRIALGGKGFSERQMTKDETLPLRQAVLHQLAGVHGVALLSAGKLATYLAEKLSTGYQGC